MTLGIEDKMRNILAGFFGLLALLAATLWITGILGVAIIPFVSARKAELIGEIALSVAILGECATYLFAWLARKAEKPHEGRFKTFGFK